MMETVRSHLLFQICSNRSSDSLNRFCEESHDTEFTRDY